MNKGDEQRYGPAAEEALKAFPIEAAKLELVSHSENLTFKVEEAGTGAPFVLRLHRPGYHTLSELNAERHWVKALGEAGLHVQRAVPTRGGDHFHQVQISGESPRFAGMTEWTEGTPLSDYVESGISEEERRHCFRQIGTLAADIHNQSATWAAPPGFQRHAFDRDGLMGEAPFWGRFWEHPGLSKAESALLDKTRKRIAEVLEALGKAPEAYSMIHADLHSENILVKDGVVTPIDFDDAGFGWHIYELAVALFMEQMRPDFEAVREAIVEGYLARRAMPARHLDLLPMFLLIRGLAIIGWLFQRPEHEAGDFLELLKASVVAECESFNAMF